MTAGESFLKQKTAFKKSRKSGKIPKKMEIIYLLLYILIDCSGSFYLRKYSLKLLQIAKKINKKNNNNNKYISSVTWYLWSFRVLLFLETIRKTIKICRKKLE
jgi:hypothetical protein